MSPERPVLLAIQHASWEAPHRILDACGELAVRSIEPLDGDLLPDHGEVAGVVAMGGPMMFDLPAGAVGQLVARSTRGFQAFADLVASNRPL